MLVVDTGPIYAAHDPDDGAHEAYKRLLEDSPGPLVVPTLVVAEVTFLAAKRIGTVAELVVLEELDAGTYQSQPVLPEDWSRIRELVATYRDFPLGTVDASVIACAERLGVTEVATLDRRHFTAVRPNHVGALTLLPFLSEN